MDFYWCFLLLRTGKDFLVHVIEACTGSRGIAPLIIKLSTRWRRVDSSMLPPLYHQPSPKRTPVPIELKAGLVPKDGLDGLKKRKRQDRKPGSSSQQPNHCMDYTLPASVLFNP